jgi:hypothetical protein
MASNCAKVQLINGRTLLEKKLIWMEKHTRKMKEKRVSDKVPSDFYKLTPYNNRKIILQHQA